MKTPARWIGAGLSLAGAALVITLLLLANRGPTLEDARAFYASQPRYMRPVPWSPPPEGLADLRAETCGACHQEIYREWQISTHARAWEDDIQFQEELAKSSKPDFDVGWMCVNCHTPMENQLPRLVARLEGGLMERPVYIDNPLFDPQLQDDAITCAVCHVRDGVVLGPYGDTDAPHPVRKDPTLLTSEVCTQCHQATAGFERINLYCFFNTGQEWAASPYAEANQTCQSCHMPEVTRPLTIMDTPPRPTRRHWFGGSLIPKQPRFAAELEPLQAIYPDGVTVRLVDPPTSAAPGQRVELQIELHNANAGHRMPTGDPERFLTIEATATGPDQTVLARLDERIGAVYQWYPKVELKSDNRLEPREVRLLTLAFTAPDAPDTSVEIRLEAAKHRISKENMEHHNLEGRVVPGRVYHASSHRVAITPRQDPPSDMPSDAPSDAP